MKKLNILLISNMYPSERQPEFAPFIKNIESALIDSGADVSKIVIEGKGQSTFEKAKKYMNLYRRMLMQDMRGFDIIHLSYPSHTYWPLLFKRLGSAKLVVRLHGEDLITNGLKESLVQILGRKWFTLPSLRRADLAVVPSKYFHEELNKTGVTPDVHIYPSGGVNRENFYSSNQINELFTIGYVGQLVEGKGVEYLLEASAALKIPHKVLVVGNGPSKDALMKQAEGLGLKNIEFTGSIPNNQLVKYYNQMNVFAFPTIRKTESFGNVSIEAMACGVPVIGSEIAGLKDYIEHGVNGYFFEPGNAKMLTEKIESFYSLDELVQASMNKSALLTAERYDSKKLTDCFVEKLFSLTDVRVGEG